MHVLIDWLRPTLKWWDKMQGVLNIIKPPHMTSHDVVAIARRSLGTKKIGHTGTLDPMAAGVLPICIGRATKIVELIQEDKKTYRCEITLGAVTDTQDVWGQILETSSVEGITEEDVKEVIKSFIGEIDQIPPMFSALKVNGKKLYELAREGVTVERKSRRRTIFNIVFIKMIDNKVWLDVECSKGTYIRTLCHDIGAKLGCGAYMSFLLRTATGIFTLDNGISVEKLQSFKMEPNLIGEHMLSVDEALCALPRGVVPKALESKLRNGVRIDLAKFCNPEEMRIDQLVRIYIEEEFLGIAKCRAVQPLEVKMEKLFNI